MKTKLGIKDKVFLLLIALVFIMVLANLFQVYNSLS
jgi:hypothetical protein